MEYFTIAHEINEEISMVRQLHEQINPPAPTPSSPSPQKPIVQNRHISKPSILDSVAGKPGIAQMLKEVERRAPSGYPQPRSRGNSQCSDQNSGQKQFPFNQRPFEFHWKQEPENVPPPKLPCKIIGPKPTPNHSSPSSMQKVSSRARAMAYTGHLSRNPGMTFLGQPKAAGPPTEAKDPMKWDPPSPKKDNRRLKPNPPPASKPPAGRESSRPSTQSQGNTQGGKRAYDKPWLTEKSVSKPKPDQSEFLLSVYPSGDGPDANLIKMLEREVIDKNPNVSFDDIAALDDAKEIIKESVLLPLLMPEYFTGIRKPRKGVLLFGPPGTGKTMLAKAVASRGKTTFFNVHSSSLASKWKGDSEKLVRLLFEMARFYAPTTIFIDEIDSLASSRGEGEHESSRKVKSELLVQIDGAAAASEHKEGEKPKNVIVLAATNLPWDLDSAIIRRLDKRIYIPLPDENARRHLFQLMLRGVSVTDDVDWDYLVAHTELYSGDDIANVCRDASMMPLRREMLRGICDSEEQARQIQEKLRNVPISMQDFKEALATVKPTNSREKLDRYVKWMHEHGST